MAIFIVPLAGTAVTSKELCVIVSLMFFPQRRKRLAAMLKLGLMRLLIRQALADNALHRFCCAHIIGDAKRHAFVVPKIELGKITL
jgi:hypothetical protein